MPKDARKRQSTVPETTITGEKYGLNNGVTRCRIKERTCRNTQKPGSRPFRKDKIVYALRNTLSFFSINMNLGNKKTPNPILLP